MSAVPTEPGSTAAGGGGEGEGEQDTGRGPLLTSEPEPVKEEPKGPRPIASVPVPGTHTCKHMCKCIHTQVSLAIYVHVFRYSMVGGVDQ